MWPFTKKVKDIPIDIDGVDVNCGVYGDQTKIHFTCQVCLSKWWEQAYYKKIDSLRAACLKCGNAAIVEEIRASYRARQSALRTQEALTKKMELQKEEALKEGGRIIDLKK